MKVGDLVRIRADTGYLLEEFVGRLGVITHCGNRTEQFLTLFPYKVRMLDTGDEIPFTAVELEVAGEEQDDEEG